MEQNQNNLTEQMLTELRGIRRQNDRQVEALQKQLKANRILTYVCLGILVFVILSNALLLPKAFEALNALESVDWEGMAASIEEVAETGQESMVSAMEMLETIDLETLNRAIADLQAIIEPLASWFR